MDELRRGSKRFLCGEWERWCVWREGKKWSQTTSHPSPQQPIQATTKSGMNLRTCSERFRQEQRKRKRQSTTIRTVVLTTVIIASLLLVPRKSSSLLSLRLLPTVDAWVSTLRIVVPAKTRLLSRRKLRCPLVPPLHETTTFSSLQDHDGDNYGGTNQTIVSTRKDLDDDIHTAHTTSLGDIMADGLVVTGNHHDGSTTTTTTTLAETYGIHHPLDRMALTANGNLQRLVSSYYDAPVHVIVDTCIRRREKRERKHVWDRVVHLTVFDQTFCTAKSLITVNDVLCQALVESGQVGLGQLFRFLDLLPAFTLHGAGMLVSSEKPPLSGGGGFWRNYTLDCPEVSCQIYEEFCPNMWELKP